MGEDYRGYRFPAGWAEDAPLGARPPRRRIAQVQIAPLAGTEYRWRYDDDTTSTWFAAPDKGMLSAQARGGADSMPLSGACACEWRPKAPLQAGKTPV